ncbi:hypothetical protein APHNP_0288 [Anaplasma phagocytophilum str. ApNP]|uniref:Uncharacterized protein n=2 Tax=Anaplasma phagocytophilum TaxID=948 RepID=A0A0F3NHV7_ANAPH|nr:hypothetical protein APHMUC_0507 [Anaplasma phagocytophilum str. ApMUC09]KJV67292.1 hypothetical protein APHNP_0288 [Anaplasma phagocytophilum str. ApNP]
MQALGIIYGETQQHAKYNNPKRSRIVEGLLKASKVPEVSQS